MPGMGRRDYRSRRLASFSKDRLRIAIDAGPAAFPFGLLFTTTGAFCLYALVLNFIQGSNKNMLSLIGASGLLLLIGGGHLVVGTLLLWRDRVTIDRRLQYLQLIKGWLGASRHRVSLVRPLTTTISIGSPRFMGLISCRKVFQVFLMTHNEDVLQVGFATTEQLAKQLEDEVRGFLELPPSHG